MKAEAGKKKVVLELGGNAGAVVDETADLDWAITRLVYGSFAYAGQVCISVQRIYVVDAIFEVSKKLGALVAKVGGKALQGAAKASRWLFDNRSAVSFVIF